MTFFRHFQNNSCISPVIYHHFLPIDHFQAFKCNVSPQGALGQNPKPTSTGGVKNPKFRKIYTTLIILSSSKEGGGETPLPTSMGGHGRIGPLHRSACLLI